MANLERGIGAGLLMVLTSTPPLYAQSVDGNGVPFRPWDVHASLGLHVGDDGDFDQPAQDWYDDDWNGTGTIQLDAGRYWTSHWKTEGSIAYIPHRQRYGSDLVPVAGGTLAYAPFETNTRVTQISAAATYQFFENVFAHPYLSVGARFGIIDFQKSRSGAATLYSTRAPVTYPIPPLEVRETIVQVRPLVAAGFKSYFDERAFIRSELSSAFGPHGLSQVTVRLGFGVDF
jgi:hypothetical protein